MLDLLPAGIEPGKIPPPFGGFIERLKHHGFTIGVDHYFRVHMVLKQLGLDTPPPRLKFLLCPLFAVNAKQQELFYRTFDDYFFVSAPLPEGDRALAAGLSGAETAEPPAPEPGGPSRRAWLLAGVAVVALFALILWKIPPTPEPAPPVVGSTEIPMAGPPTERRPNLRINIPLTSTPPPDLTFYQRYYRHLRWAGIGLPMILFVMVELYRWRRRRLVLQRRRRDLRRKQPPLFWRLQVNPPPPAFTKTSLFHAAAHGLRRRTESGAFALDLDQTIRATTAQGGFPVLRYKALTRPPEYLFLIDLPENRNHYSLFTATVADALAGEGLFVTRLFFSGDPQICFESPGQERHYLADILERYRHCRLILVGTGEALLDPISGEPAPWTALFNAWAERAVLTTRRPAHWGPTELSLARDFIVLPATFKGLEALRTHFDNSGPGALRPWIQNDHQPAMPDGDRLNQIAALKTYLGDNDTFQWLCACAVYPELHWNLTLSLGIALLKHTRIQEEKLLRLIRLPWFRHGRMPEALRLALIAELEPEKLQGVRESIFTILKQNPPPVQSLAYDGYRLHLAAYRAMLDRGARKTLRKAAQTARMLHEHHLTRDFILLEFLDAAAASPLRLVLPKALHELFFKKGLPLFGLKSGVRALFYATVAALCLLLPTPELPRLPAAGQVALEFAHIPPGTFTMGSPADEPGRNTDEAQHAVTLTQGLYLQTTELTQGQWRSVMGANPSRFKACGDDCPVESVSWEDAQAFITRLNRMDPGRRYRLPTEAEWEYAARAGSLSTFANGGITDIACGDDPKLDALGWYCGNSSVSYAGCFDASKYGGPKCTGTHPVALKNPNAWGLYDMHGNVWEWCADWYAESPEGGNDPAGPSEPSGRVTRGGSWGYDARYCRAATRLSREPGDRDLNLGFRLALPPGQLGQAGEGGDGAGLGRGEGRDGAGLEPAETPDGTPRATVAPRPTITPSPSVVPRTTVTSRPRVTPSPTTRVAPRPTITPRATSAPSPTVAPPALGPPVLKGVTNY